MSERLRVARVGSNSPQRGLLETGDILLTCDGAELHSLSQLGDSMRLASKTAEKGGPPTVLFTLLRHGEQREIALPAAHFDGVSLGQVSEAEVQQHVEAARNAVAARLSKEEHPTIIELLTRHSGRAVKTNIEAHLLFLVHATEGQVVLMRGERKVYLAPQWIQWVLDPGKGEPLEIQVFHLPTAPSATPLFPPALSFPNRGGEPVGS